MRAPTDGQSFRASQTALVKNDIKPSPTPYFSLNLSLYLERISIMGDISTSLKVVSMAVSFLTATRRLATVLRNKDIFSRRSERAPVAATSALATIGSAFLTGASAGAPFGVCGFSDIFS